MEINLGLRLSVFGWLIAMNSLLRYAGLSSVEGYVVAINSNCPGYRFSMAETNEFQRYPAYLGETVT